MFGQGFFQIDPNLTPEELQSRRERIQSMMPDGRARYVGEGLADLGAGIFAGVTGRKLNKIERENRQKAQDLFNGLMGGGSSGPVVGPLTVLGMPPGDITSGPIDDGQSVANDTMAALGREPMDATANIRSGLIKRGLPEHVADAFIMNMRDESGLKTDINEAAPIVPGSRGGYGLIQWTGPRRRQLEAFAAARGTAPSDLNTQLDFLMTELQGPEARAGQAILSTKTAPEAAAVILNDFLRPAEEHRARREAAYLGGAQPRVAASPSTTAQPLGTAQPGAVAQPAGGMDDLYSALQNPWLTAPQRAVVMQMIQQRQQASDPMRALQMEKAQLELEALRNPQPKPTDDMREYEFAKSQGYQGTFTDFMTDMRRAGATNITNTVGSGEVGTIPQGYELFTDPETGARSMRPIAGGPEDTSQTEEAQRQAAIATTDILNNAALRARDAAKGRAFGEIGQGLTAMLPWTDSAEVARQLEVLKSQAKIQNLTAMRKASPTGGALGAVSDAESKMLADASGALDPNSPYFERDLADYYRTLLRVVHGQQAGDDIFDQMWGGDGATGHVTHRYNPATGQVEVIQ